MRYLSKVSRHGPNLQLSWSIGLGRSGLLKYREVVTGDILYDYDLQYPKVGGSMGFNLFPNFVLSI